jgi:hypothetical protein
MSNSSEEEEEPNRDSESSDDSFFHNNTDWEEEEDSDDDSIPDSLCSELDNDTMMRIIQNKETLIGYSFLYQETRISPFHHLFIHRLSPTTFYRFPTDKLEYYLEYYSFEWNYHYAPDAPRIRIIQIEHIYTDISPEPEFLVIDKTFWLRLVQRTWKRKYYEKRRLERARGSIQNQRHFELRGQYLPGYNHLSILPLF